MIRKLKIDVMLRIWQLSVITVAATDFTNFTKEMPAYRSKPVEGCSGIETTTVSAMICVPLKYLSCLWFEAIFPVIQASQEPGGQPKFIGRLIVSGSD